MLSEAGGPICHLSTAIAAVISLVALRKILIVVHSHVAGHVSLSLHRPTASIAEDGRPKSMTIYALLSGKVFSIDGLGGG